MEIIVDQRIQKVYNMYTNRRGVYAMKIPKTIRTDRVIKYLDEVNKRIVMSENLVERFHMEGFDDGVKIISRELSILKEIYELAQSELLGIK